MLFRSDADNPLVYQTSQIVSALPFLTYQKIYFDVFSNSQWEKHLAYAYNVDYWSGTGQISLVTDMVKLRYANYPKDYFMGMLPASQYGSVAVLPSYLRSDLSSNIILAGGISSSNFDDNPTVVNPPSGSSVIVNNLNSAPIVTGKQIGRASCREIV